MACFRAQPLCRYDRGFTFIELMITLAILGVLAMLAVPLGQTAVKQQREKDLRVALMEIRRGLDAYKRAADQGRIPMKLGDSGYPKTLEELVEGVPDQKSPSKQMIYFLRRLPRDPMNANTSVSAADTWGRRSYQSPPDAPIEGADIFDIHSLSDNVGGNGIPYRQW